MEPISTALAGFALVKQSVDFIKGNIETVNDIRDIFGHVENILNGEQQIQKERFADKGVLGQTKSAAQSVIDAKLAKEAMDEMHALIDNRFGYGTWQEIVDERAKRLKEEREEEARLKQQRAKKKAEFQKNMMIFATGGMGFFVVILGLFAVIYFTGGIN